LKKPAKRKIAIHKGTISKKLKKKFIIRKKQEAVKPARKKIKPVKKSVIPKKVVLKALNVESPKLVEAEQEKPKEPIQEPKKQKKVLDFTGILLRPHWKQMIMEIWYLLACIVYQLIGMFHILKNHTDGAKRPVLLVPGFFERSLVFLSLRKRLIQEGHPVYIAPLGSQFGNIRKKSLILDGFISQNKLKDFYEYDPSANIWTKKADFGGTARYGAIAMAIGNKGYVGTGYDASYLKDIWEYDPATDIWTQKSSIGGSKRRDASCFVINGKGYVTTGIDNGEYLTDLWQYDPGADTWTKKRAIADLSNEAYDDKYSTIKGIGKVGFTVNGKGYLATGGQTTGVEAWEYDPITDLWIEKSNFEGAIRSDAVGFGISNRGYVTTGKSSSYYFDDIWAFDPDADFNDKD